MNNEMMIIAMVEGMKKRQENEELILKLLAENKELKEENEMLHKNTNYEFTKEPNMCDCCFTSLSNGEKCDNCSGDDDDE